GGGYLLALGGSPYYALCGAAVLASAVLLWQGRWESAVVYACMLLATVAWAIWEAGTDGWALAPRLIAPAVLGLVFLIPSVNRALTRRSRPWSAVAVAGSLVVAVGAGV